MLVLVVVGAMVLLLLLAEVIEVARSALEVNSSLTPLYTMNMNFCDLSERRSEI